MKRIAQQLAPFLESSRPQITETQVDGDTARVLAIVQWVALKPSGATVVELPATFYLEREPSGDWKLANNSFLDYRLRIQQEADKAGN